MKRYNAKRLGRAFGAECRDDDFTTWMHTLPCAICQAANLFQYARTEVEHWVKKSDGGRDKGDTFPTCQVHREYRHGAPEGFAKLLRRLKIAPKKLCKWYERQYEAEAFPCP